MKIKRFHFLLFWLVLNIVQGSFTELTSDEGYYWFFSRSSEWGYYDHPPFLAWIIAAGYALFQTELGVRLFNILLSTAALFLFFKLVSPYIKNLIAFLIILSMPLLNYITFIVFPDGPLIFFSVIFLLAYKRFLERKDLASSLMLGTALAFMLYSKYQGILILGFTVLSNPALLRSKLFYLSQAVALVLFFPHLWWQYVHDYPTIRYHLSGRMSSFSASHVFEYLSQQIPSIGPALIFIPFVYKTTDQFEKTLKYIILGTFAFFLVASFRTFVHFHWTSVVIFPILFLAVKFYSSEKRIKLLLWLALPFVVFLTVIRIQLISPIFPVNHVNVDYYSGRKLWADDIAKLSAGNPVLFQDNFREAGLFSFYSKQTAATFFSGTRRKSQYDIWHYEDSLQQKNILYISSDPFPGGKELLTRMNKKIYYRQLINFSSYYDVIIRATCTDSPKSDFVQLSIDITNPRQQLLSFVKDTGKNEPVLYYKIESEKTVIQTGSVQAFSEVTALPAGETHSIHMNMPVGNLKQGLYKVIFGFQTGLLPDSYNGEITLKII